MNKNKEENLKYASCGLYFEIHACKLNNGSQHLSVTFDHQHNKSNEMHTLFCLCFHNSYLNMSPRPLSIPFLALILSFSLSRSFFLSFPIFFRSPLSWPPFMCLSSEWDGWSLDVETDSLPDRELSSVSSSTERIRSFYW